MSLRKLFQRQADPEDRAAMNPYITKKGNKYWRNKGGQFHREDGPAIEYASGGKEWRRDDLLHRADGPALEFANGDKVWYLNGKLHREDGAAVEHADGTYEWHLNGKRMSSAELLAAAVRSISIAADPRKTAEPNKITIRFKL